MSGQIDAERILDAFLAPEADRLPDRVLDAALDDIARTPQRRAQRVPWRFPFMPALSRTTAMAGVVLLAVIGAGGFLYLNSTSPDGFGGRTPSPTQVPTTAPTAAPTVTPTPEPSYVAPGITGWTTYTSVAYGITFGYPEHWHLEGPATRTWQAGDGIDFGPFTDTFASPDGDDQVGMWVFRVAAGSADIGSREGLGAFLCELEASTCQAISDVAEPMCHGRVACLPAVLVPLPHGVLASFADTETRMVTVVQLGRGDTFPGAARYGGTVQLLRSILTTMDVWTPEPGQIPSQPPG